MPKINKNIITYDSEDWLAGLHPQNSSSNLLQQGKGFYVTRSINPYRFLGYLTVGENLVAITNASTVMTSKLKQGVNLENYGYLIEDTKLHLLNIITKTLLNDTAGVGYPHTITAHGGHSGVVSSDIILYNHKVGGTSARRALYSWSDNTDWDIGTCDLAVTGAAAFDDDFMSTAPATPLSISGGYEAGKGYPHPMIVGHDDIVYIADRNFVHAYDGQNAADNDGKFFAESFVLPKEYIIYGFAKLSPRSLAIFASNGSLNNSLNYAKTSVFIWNYLDLDPDYIKEIPENTVRAPFEYRGTIGCFAYGRSGRYGLYLFNGTNFEKVITFTGGEPLNGGVNILGDEIQWLSGGKIWSYGNQYGQKSVLNCIDDIGTTGNGFYRTFSTILGRVTSYGTKSFSYFSPGSYTSVSNGGFLNTAYLPIGKIRIKKVKVYFARVTNGIGISLSAFSYDNAADLYELIKISNITKKDMVTVNYGLDTSGNKIPELNGIALNCTFDEGSGTTACAIIRKIEIEYESTEFT